MAKSPSPKKKKKKESGPTNAEKKALEAAGMVLARGLVPFGQMSAPVDPKVGTTARSSDRRYGPLVDVDAAGKFTSPLVEGKSFDSLFELLQSIP